MKKLVSILALSSLTLATPANAFDVGDAIQIVDAVSGLAGAMTRPAPMPTAEPSRMNDDYDMECRFRGFDGWYDNKCQNLSEN